MKATGIIRRIDDLGRVVIPKRVREAIFGTSDTAGQPMEVFYERDGSIIFKPYHTEVVLTDITGVLGEWLDVGFDPDIPREVVVLLTNAYRQAVAVLNKG